MKSAPATVSIIIPVFNKLRFTRQCLDSIARHASEPVRHQIIVVDNASTDGTDAYLRDLSQRDARVRHVRHEANLGFARANNAGARLATGEYLLFLNNDTIVQPGWLDAMIEVAQSSSRVGIVGIKQLFPYTNTIHHTGIIFGADRRPQHIYPHADASLRHVNQQREYQAVTGSCLLIERGLFAAAGMFDEGYVNGYEDVDLCLTVRSRNRSVVCCTTAFIYHYGQITDTRTADDDANLARFLDKWGDRVTPDELSYFNHDHASIEAARLGAGAVMPSRAADPALIYFADELSTGSALTWVTAELVLALEEQRLPVALAHCTLPPAVEPAKRRRLESLMRPAQPIGGVQIRWSHYWPQHLGIELTGRTNLELFVINYLFERPGTQPWDYWLQGLAQNGHRKLPLSTFCRDVLAQTGVDPGACHILRPGYSPEIHDVAGPARSSGRFRFLTVTNSHDLERYGTLELLAAYWQAFAGRDDVELVVKDYGRSSGDTRLPRLLKSGANRAPVAYITEFTDKARLIELYKSCDAFVSAHRGEGYGMKLLDALACGLPVITPLFGGPTDFCSADNCYPVEFAMAPVGDCYDTRALRIFNGPVWAEPDRDSLVSQLRRVAANQDEARRLGQRAAQDALARFSWQETARSLGGFLATLDLPPSRRPARPPVHTPPAERSPYWMGRRVSVVIPTYNRKDVLLTCLEALERQSILPQEFEVVIVDDGSTDGTEDMLHAREFPFGLKYCRQENRGPATARNAGIQLAEGELILFMGDDIIADERLLEQHLTAHATRPQVGAAVLGHIDWPPDMPVSRVMDFVCGESTLQFAYAFIPRLPELDYRFFYTSNISLKRDFLLDAAADGVHFDPDFRFAAFEDSEYAYRLQKRGLHLHYHADALAYHQHPMDLDSFARREYLVGRMAVVFYRKHPRIDDQLQVRWVGEWAEAVDALASQPELDANLRALDADTDALLQRIAQTLEGMLRLHEQTEAPPTVPRLAAASLTTSLHAVLAVIFDIERTRGKVEEWYESVRDPATIERAKRLIGCMRKLEFFSARAGDIRNLQRSLPWLNQSVVAGLEERIRQLERELGVPGAAVRRMGGRARRAARKVDLLIQAQLSRRAGLLARYHSVRERLKRLLPAPGPSAQ